MFKKYFNIRYKRFTGIIYLLIFAFTLNACHTTKTEIVETEKLKKADEQIKGASHIVFKDGTYISVINKDVFFKSEYKDNTNVIVVRDKKLSTETYTQKTKDTDKENIYLLDKIKEIYVQREEIDAGKTILAVLGSIAAAALIFIIFVGIELSNHPPRSCPYIYSYDGSKYIMDAEPLGGAVCEGLERTDVSRLENLINTDSEFIVLVKNVNDEQQRIDCMKFISINHERGEYIAPDNKGNFYRYKNPLKPINATNETGFDISKFLYEKDDVRWFNDLPNDTAKMDNTPKETLKIRFPKPKGVSKAMLMINGGASYFGSNMIKEMLDLKGNGVDEWYKSIYQGSDEQKRLFNAMHGDESYYLDIKVNNDKGLQNTGIMASNGPIVDEDILYPIDLSNHNSDYVEIVLTPQRYFWKFDQISMTYDFDKVDKNNISEVQIEKANDNNGIDIRNLIAGKDKEYYKMPNVGDYTEMKLKVPEGFSKETSQIFAVTTGYYEINLSKNGIANNKQINDILFKDNELFRYAVSLYKNKISEIAKLLNSTL